MPAPRTRRHALKQLGGALASVLPVRAGQAPAPRRVEIQLAPVSAHTVRISIVPVDNGHTEPVPSDGSLVQETWGAPVARWRDLTRAEKARCGDLVILLSPDPLLLRIETAGGSTVQQLRLDLTAGTLAFRISDGPVFGLGEGGPQFDRRGSVDRMRNGEGGYRLRTHGSRVPIPWLIGAAGWAMFIHRPYGSFDLTGEEGLFQPLAPGKALPLDIFITGSRKPAVIMAEYARLTGHPEMPPLWAFGYQQSHRTLASREEILAEARTFREKKLPCDALIYLGTGFCPSGWNTANGSFTWNSNVFPDPEKMIQELHGEHFKVVLHAVILSRKLRGTVRDRCELSRFDEQEAGCYWDMHRRDFAMGVDGWWPDEGDSLDAASRLVRNRMYWEGPQIDRPNERPYALHRNGYAGMQRNASFLWSGDINSTWETLRTHISVAINSALSGIPYWGADIGGFIPTREFTGELYVRWFQFGAFCPLFRAHGRTWKLRLPWGWNTGELGPSEISNYGDAADPDPSELHNAAVEPICRKYLELRYQLLPYLYSAVHEAHETGMPILRALWLHYPDDPAAVTRGDEYLWGRDILVAPVTEKGATSRRLYLPRGSWYDFWTEERIEGGREISRAVDLPTMPLYVRAGSIVPLGPVKQYTGEPAGGPLTLWVYPGAGATFALYEDDGVSFNDRRGEWMGVDISWNESRRRLSLRLAAGSRMLPPARREIDVRIASERTARTAIFEGRPLEVQF